MINFEECGPLQEEKFDNVSIMIILRKFISLQLQQSSYKCHSLNATVWRELQSQTDWRMMEQEQDTFPQMAEMEEADFVGMEQLEFVDFKQK